MGGFAKSIELEMRESGQKLLITTKFELNPFMAMYGDFSYIDPAERAESTSQTENLLHLPSGSCQILY